MIVWTRIMIEIFPVCLCGNLIQGYTSTIENIYQYISYPYFNLFDKNFCGGYSGVCCNSFGSSKKWFLEYVFPSIWFLHKIILILIHLIAFWDNRSALSIQGIVIIWIKKQKGKDDQDNTKSPQRIVMTVSYRTICIS